VEATFGLVYTVPYLIEVLTIGRVRSIIYCISRCPLYLWCPPVQVWHY